MIVDLDGATWEPTRRGHVLVLSVAAATVSLLALVALFAPAPRPAALPLAAAPSPTASSRLVIVGRSDPGVVIFDQVVTRPSDDMTSTLCAAGVGSNSPVHLVLDRSGRVIAAYTTGRTGRFIPLPQAYVDLGWLTVPCDPSDVFAPRLNRAR